MTDPEKVGSQSLDQGTQEALRTLGRNPFSNPGEVREGVQTILNLRNEGLTNDPFVQRTLRYIFNYQGEKEDLRERAEGNRACIGEVFLDQVLPEISEGIERIEAGVALPQDRVEFESAVQLVKLLGFDQNSPPQQFKNLLDRANQHILTTAPDSKNTGFRGWLGGVFGGRPAKPASVAQAGPAVEAPLIPRLRHKQAIDIWMAFTKKNPKYREILTDDNRDEYFAKAGELIASQFAVDPKGAVKVLAGVKEDRRIAVLHSTLNRLRSAQQVEDFSTRLGHVLPADSISEDEKRAINRAFAAAYRLYEPSRREDATSEPARSAPRREERETFSNGFVAFTRDEIFDMVPNRHDPLPFEEAVQRYDQRQRWESISSREYKPGGNEDEQTNWQRFMQRAVETLEGEDISVVALLGGWYNRAEFLLADGTVLQVIDWRQHGEGWAEQRDFDVPIVRSNSSNEVSWYIQQFSEGLAKPDEWTDEKNKVAYSFAKKLFDQGCFFGASDTRSIGIDKNGSIWLRTYNSARVILGSELRRLKELDVTYEEYRTMREWFFNPDRMDDKYHIGRGQNALNQLGEKKFRAWYGEEAFQALTKPPEPPPAPVAAASEPVQAAPANEPSLAAPEPEASADRFTNLLAEIQQKIVQVKNSGGYLIVAHDERGSGVRNAANIEFRRQAEIVAQFLINAASDEERAPLIQQILKNSPEVQDAVELELGALTVRLGEKLDLREGFRRERYGIDRVLQRAKDPANPFQDLRFFDKLHILGYSTGKWGTTTVDISPPQIQDQLRVLEEDLIRQVVERRNAEHVDTEHLFENLSLEGVKFFDSITKGYSNLRSDWREAIDKRLKEAESAKPAPEPVVPETASVPEPGARGVSLENAALMIGLSADEIERWILDGKVTAERSNGEWLVGARSLLETAAAEKEAASAVEVKPTTPEPAPAEPTPPAAPTSEPAVAEEVSPETPASEEVDQGKLDKVLAVFEEEPASDESSAGTPDDLEKKRRKILEDF